MKPSYPRCDEQQNLAACTCHSTRLAPPKLHVEQPPRSLRLTRCSNSNWTTPPPRPRHGSLRLPSRLDSDPLPRRPSNREISRGSHSATGPRSQCLTPSAPYIRDLMANDEVCTFKVSEALGHCGVEVHHGISDDAQWLLRLRHANWASRFGQTWPSLSTSRRVSSTTCGTLTTDYTVNVMIWHCIQS
ncbi:uncharacterized protein BKA78DRAFT_163394 [Phyllosticta capitalensis]|uniref:uncharacterized protein n=1 Tax=Phyllosticta capitalensis TaxID=121624 RepID=UPI00312D0800